MPPALKTTRFTGGHEDAHNYYSASVVFNSALTDNHLEGNNVTLEQTEYTGSDDIPHTVSGNLQMYTEPSDSSINVCKCDFYVDGKHYCYEAKFTGSEPADDDIELTYIVDAWYYFTHEEIVGFLK